MRHLQAHILVFGLTLLFGCAKKSALNDVSSQSLLKVMQVSEPFFARGALELKDGSLILGAVAPIAGDFDEFNNISSLAPSLLVKYTAEGKLLWQTVLPEVVHVLWETMELRNGNIAVVGFNSDDNSKQIGLAFISPDGELLSQHSYFNITSSYPLRELNPIACLELSSGNIALATSTSNVSNAYIAIRLVVFDKALNEVFDRVYAHDTIVQNRPPGQVSIVEDATGNIILHGLDYRFETNVITDTTNIYAFALKLSSVNYDPIYYQSFENAQAFSPSNCVLSNSGKLVWASCGPLPEDSAYNSWFNQRNQELYLTGPEITLWQTDGNTNNTKKYRFSGFPKRGFINKLIKTSDGGYLLLGTCNINPNQELSSEYKVMMIKLSANISLEWMKFPNTNSQSVANDIVETTSGYIISATHLSLRQQNRPILFKTDKNGNLN
jgi:hypothetical protein